MECEVKEEVSVVREEVRRAMDEIYEIIAYLERLEEGGQPVNSSHVQSKPGSSSTMTLPIFDGETSWELYKRQFEAAAISNGWTKQQGNHTGESFGRTS